MDFDYYRATISKMDAVREAVAEDHSQGLSTRDDAARSLAQLSDIFGEALETMRLRRVSPRSSLDANQLMADYKSWKDGAARQLRRSSHWLVRVGENGELEEAEPEEKEAYFELAKAALVEIIAAPVPPEEIDAPSWSSISYGNGERIKIPFVCVDDGGLLSEEDPAGKTFTLLGQNNLRVEIEVTKRLDYDFRPVGHQGIDFDGYLRVEGFTVDELCSPGTVCSCDGSVISVSYNNLTFIDSANPAAKRICSFSEYEEAREASFPDDQFFVISTKHGERNSQAFYSYPRWQPYFAWKREHQPILLTPSRDEYLEELLETT